MAEVSKEEAQEFLRVLTLKAHTSGVSDGFTLAIGHLEDILRASGAHQRIGLALGIAALKTAKNFILEDPITPNCKEGL